VLEFRSAVQIRLGQLTIMVNRDRKPGFAIFKIALKRTNHNFYIRRRLSFTESPCN
jgi:hypothetical protein